MRCERWPGRVEGSYTDLTLTAGVTVIKALHLTDLRSALNAARTALLLPPVTYSRPGIVAGTTIISAVDINDCEAGCDERSYPEDGRRQLHTVILSRADGEGSQVAKP